MNEENRPPTAEDRLPAIGQILRTLQLVLRLMVDRRVPVLPKLIIPAAILYILSPIDLMPDFILGLGQADDLAILVLGISLFIELCPPNVVEEHRRAIGAGTGAPVAPKGEVVEGTYRVMDDDER